MAFQPVVKLRHLAIAHVTHEGDHLALFHRQHVSRDPQHDPPVSIAYYADSKKRISSVVVPSIGVPHSASSTSWLNPVLVHLPPCRPLNPDGRADAILFTCGRCRVKAQESSDSRPRATVMICIEPHPVVATKVGTHQDGTLRDSPRWHK